MARDWLSEIGLAPDHRYDGMERHSRDGMYWLSSVLSGYRMAEQESDWPLLFVINTIAQIVPREGGVEVRGVCSPFVRGS
jgi:hypothetical protein